MVNLKSTVTNKIKDIIAKEEFNRDMFKGAREEIYFLMSKDNFARFRASKSFAKLLGDVQAYSTRVVNEKQVEDANRRLSGAADENEKQKYMQTFDKEFREKRLTQMNAGKRS
eukprot:g1535.t1